MSEPRLGHPQPAILAELRRDDRATDGRDVTVRYRLFAVVVVFTGDKQVRFECEVCDLHGDVPEALRRAAGILLDRYGWTLEGWAPGKDARDPIVMASMIRGAL